MPTTGPNDPASAYPPAPSSGEVLVSGRPLYKVSGAFTVTSGTESSQAALLTDVEEVSGEDYWGVPDSALPLPMTVPGGVLTYPPAAEDRIFDIETSIAFYPDTADIGKFITVAVSGNDGEAEVVCPVVQLDPEGGTCMATFSWVDRVFLTDTDCTINTSVYAGKLTEPARQTGTLSHTVMQR